MANNLVQSAGCTAGAKLIAGCTAGAELIIKSNMAESLSVRERPDTGYYKELHNISSDILYKTKKGKRRKAAEDVFYEVERVISRRVIKGKVKHEYTLHHNDHIDDINMYWL